MSENWKKTIQITAYTLICTYAKFGADRYNRMLQIDNKLLVCLAMFSAD